MTRSTSILTGLLVFLVFLPLTGCSKGPPSTVEGKVLVDGKPLEIGSIDFLPKDGKGPVSGGTITNGQYSVDLYPGEKTVSIVGQKFVREEKDPAMSTPRQVYESVVPPRYNRKSELVAQITDGDTVTQDFDLKSK